MDARIEVVGIGHGPLEDPAEDRSERAHQLEGCGSSRRILEPILQRRHVAQGRRQSRRRDHRHRHDGMDRGGRRSDQDLEGARLRHPTVAAWIPEGERARIESHLHGPRLPRLEAHLREAPKLLAGTLHRCLDIPHVDLDDLASRTAARIGDIDGDGHAVGVRDGGRRRAGTVIPEGRIRQAVPEREGHRQIPRLVPAIADVQPLAIPDRVAVAREVEVRGGVLEPERERLGEAAGRVDHAEQDVRDRPTGGLARVPRLEDRGGAVDPRRHGHGGAIEQDHDGPGLHGADRADQRHVLRCEVQVCPIATLRFLRDRHRHEDDGDIRIGGGRDGGCRRGRGAPPLRRRTRPSTRWQLRPPVV